MKNLTALTDGSAMTPADRAALAKAHIAKIEAFRNEHFMPQADDPEHGADWMREENAILTECCNAAIAALTAPTPSQAVAEPVTQHENPVAGGHAVRAAEDWLSAEGGSPSFTGWANAEFGDVRPSDIERLEWAFNSVVKYLLSTGFPAPAAESPEGVVVPRRVVEYVFAVSGEGLVDVTLCYGRDGVRKAYVDGVCGDDDAAHKDEIEAFMEKFDDADNWGCGTFNEELYCGHITIIKPDNFHDHAAAPEARGGDK